MTNTQNRMVLLGLDGATFQLLDPLMAEGVLPCLKSAIENGCRGVLNSTIPPSTAPAWASCITGVNPGKHGVFDFRGPLGPGGRRALIDSRSIKAEKIWSILNRHGRRAGIINLPVSYPPEPLAGFMISGMMTPGPRVSYTFPSSLQNRLGDYSIDLKSQAYEIASVGDAERFLWEIWMMFDRRWQVFWRLMEEEEWDLLMAVFVLFDRIQHRLWKYLDLRCELAHTPTGQRVREVAFKILRRSDERLGTLFANLPSDTSLLIVSDHGFGPLDALFNVNRWLVDLDMLTLHKGAYLKSRLFRTAAELGTKPSVRRLLPSSVNRHLRERIRRQRTLLKQSIEEKIHWDASQAYFPSNLEQGIHILPQAGSKADKMEGCRYKIIDELHSLTMPRDAKPLVDEIYPRESIFQGPWVEQAAALYMKCRDYTVLGNTQPGRRDWFTYLDDDPRGFHQLDGVLIAIGPNIRAGRDLPTCSIMDIAPTVLYAMGLPVPETMDGQVVGEAFAPSFWERHPVSREKGSSPSVEPESTSADYSEEEAETLSERLRALGYL